jgi:hypothetical protein
MTVRRVLNNGCVARLLAMVIVLGIALGVTALVEHLNAPEPVAPLLIGHAPATSTGHVDVSQEADDDGYAPAEDWPNACDFLTDQDIRSILPQLTGPIQRTPSDVQIDVFDVSGQTAGENIDVPDANCKITFHLPNSDNDSDYPSNGESEIDVGVDAVGDPATLQQNVQSDSDDSQSVEQGCAYRAGYTDYLCGHLQVGVSLSSLDVTDRSDEDTPVDRIQVGGKVTTFHSGDSAAESKFEDTYVTPELVKAMLAKLAQ